MKIAKEHTPYHQSKGLELTHYKANCIVKKKQGLRLLAVQQLTMGISELA